MCKKWEEEALGNSMGQERANSCPWEGEASHKGEGCLVFITGRGGVGFHYRGPTITRAGGLYLL